MDFRHVHLLNDALVPVYEALFCLLEKPKINMLTKCFSDKI